MVVEQATDEMLTLIDQAKAYVDEDRERFFTEVEQLLDPVSGFSRFARSVMAAYYAMRLPNSASRFEAELQTHPRAHLCGCAHRIRRW